jgi:predicted HD phosphohydrolase
MKNFLLACFIFLSGTVFSQEEGVVLDPSTLCSYYGEELKSGVSFLDDNKEAELIIQRIINVIGLKPHFKIKAANVPNAAAVIYNNQRYVLYNPEFIAALNKASGNSWVSVSILSHEIGHHLNGHTLEEGGSLPDIELEADEFSGFILRKLGATLEDAQAAMKVAASVKASHTHPAREDRLKSIARGWNNAAADLATAQKKNDVEKPVVDVAPKVQHRVLDDKYIAKDVNFHSDPKGMYYVTIRGNFVKVENEKLYVIGRLAQSNKKEYPLMLHDNMYNYMYINKKGQIYNTKGKRLGSIRDHK